MNTDATKALRDIHLPETTLWWPPAPGWWLLMALAIITSIALIAFLRSRKTGPYTVPVKNLALAELQHIESAFQKHQNAQRLTSELSALLRRVCISLYPRKETASLTGRQWLTFLDEQWPENTQRFTAETGLSLLSAPYQKNPAVDTAALLKLCREWLTTVPADSSQRSEQ